MTDSSEKREQPTPRTDAAAFKQNDGVTRYSTVNGAALKIVTADFARQLERELAEAKAVIAWANNSLFGSHGFFLSLNGGPANEHHLDMPIEALKKDSRELHQLKAVVTNGTRPVAWRTKRPSRGHDFWIYYEEEPRHSEDGPVEPLYTAPSHGGVDRNAGLEEAVRKVLARLTETDDHGYTPIHGDERDALVEALEDALHPLQPSATHIKDPSVYDETDQHRAAKHGGRPMTLRECMEAEEGYPGIAHDFETMRLALQQCLLVIDDQVNLYAPELCEPKRVEEAKARHAAGGTLAYYADAIKAARDALRTPSSGETRHRPEVQECLDAIDAHQAQINEAPQAVQPSDQRRPNPVEIASKPAPQPAGASPSSTAERPSEKWKFWRTARVMELEPYYCYWVSHLTSEDLHAKADIATVLAILHQQRDDNESDALRLHRDKMDLIEERIAAPSTEERTDRWMLNSCLKAMQSVMRSGGKADWSIMIADLQRHLSSPSTARERADG